MIKYKNLKINLAKIPQIINDFSTQEDDKKAQEGFKFIMEKIYKSIFVDRISFANYQKHFLINFDLNMISNETFISDIIVDKVMAHEVKAMKKMKLIAWSEVHKDYNYPENIKNNHFKIEFLDKKHNKLINYLSKKTNFVNRINFTLERLELNSYFAYDEELDDNYEDSKCSIIVYHKDKQYMSLLIPYDTEDETENEFILKTKEGKEIKLSKDIYMLQEKELVQQFLDNEKMYFNEEAKKFITERI